MTGDSEELIWPRSGSESGPDLMLFRARLDTFVNPRTAERLRRLVLETPDWCTVVALTPERRVVLTRQYRFGIGAVTLEIPGGTVAPGERHKDAARRELREETGYTARRWTYLGSSFPNAAFHDNLCHHWLAEGAVRSHSQDLGDGEHISIVTMTLDEARAGVLEGAIRHSLGIAALCRVLDVRCVDLSVAE